jgi:hypothetical protein
MKWRLALLLMFSTSASALIVVKLPFDEMVQLASLVVVGKVERVERQVHSEFRSSYAMVRIESLLKGTAPELICVVTRPEIAERSFSVTGGRRYLFLLTHYGKDCFTSVNGSAAVIPVDGEPG